MFRKVVRQLIPVALIIGSAAIASAQPFDFNEGPDIKCTGNMGQVQNVTITFTGRTNPGDEDNDYTPYCAANVKLSLDGKLVAEGGLDALSGVPGFPAERIVEFKAADVPPALAEQFVPCTSLNFGGEMCLQLIETEAGSGIFMAKGHQEDSLRCQAAPLEQGECE